MKILVIFTGGTIGSRVHDKHISPDSKAKYFLIEEYRQYHGDDIDFDFLEPYTILSENLTADNINRLISVIKENLDKGYDGIIVTHGTDTLQYTASALSFALGSACLPILLVSSSYPLEDPRSNGQSHFGAAISLLSQKKCGGILVPYRTVDGEVIFYRPYSILSFAERGDKLDCLLDCRYATIDKDGTLSCSSREYFLRPVDFTLVCNPEILVIDSHPADSFSYSLNNVNAVIIKPYHSGTLDTANPKFAKFCKTAYQKGIPVFAVNAPSGITYKSVQLFDNMQITALPDSVYINTYVKVWIGISLRLTGEKLQKFVKE